MKKIIIFLIVLFSLVSTSFAEIETTDLSSVIPSDTDVMWLVRGSSLYSTTIGNILALANIPTQASLSVDDLITLSGVSEGAQSLGVFSGSLIADNSTVKGAIQALEVAVESLAGGHDAVTIASGISGLTLDGQELSLQADLEAIADGSWSPTLTLDLSGATVTFGLEDGDIPAAIARDTELHDAVTIASGIGGLTLSTQELSLHANIEVLADFVDPDADRIWFWDDSEGAFAALTIGDNLSITGTTLSAALSGGTVDTTGTPAQYDIPRFTDSDTIEGLSYSELAAVSGFETALEAVLDISDLQGTLSLSQLATTGSWSPTATIDLSGASVAFGLATTDLPTTGDWTPTSGTWNLGALTITIPGFKNGATSAGFIRLYEDSDFGSNYVDIIGPSSITSNDSIQTTMYGLSLLETVDESGFQSLFSLVVGEDVQAWDTDLDTWATVTPGANVGTFLAAPSTTNFWSMLTGEGAFASTLLGYENAAAVLSGIGAQGTLTNSEGLRAALSDEVGTGAAYFVGGALGTPASGNASNLTNFPTLNQNTTGTAANVTGIVAIANGGTGATTAATAATALGVGTTSSPQFTAINLGHASDTTIARSAAGLVTIEGAHITKNPMTTTGDMLYSSTTATPGAAARLAAVALGSVLTSKGVGTAPAWDSAPQITSVNLGHASDTTISRSAAGVVTIESRYIPTSAQAQRIYVSDDCTGETGMVAGDLCFEY